MGSTATFRPVQRRMNNRVQVPSKCSVLSEWSAEPWFTERMKNGIRINTGNDDFLPFRVISHTPSDTNNSHWIFAGSRR